MISVCIPTFEQYGYGAKHLAQLLDSILPQKGDYEVIISDNSKDSAIKDLLARYTDHLDFKYIHNPILGISANTNNAIQHATSNRIKLMYMDDVLMSNDALKQFDSMLDKYGWCYSDSIIINGQGNRAGTKKATYNPAILSGLNTIGMPSVTAFRKSDLLFDPNLKVLLDCEYYWMLNQKFGPAGYLRGYHVGMRYHDNSTSRKQVNEKYVKKEYEYLKKKHNLA